MKKAILSLMFKIDLSLVFKKDLVFFYINSIIINVKKIWKNDFSWVAQLMSPSGLITIYN